jgi:AraC-like DNA-binding protein
VTEQTILASDLRVITRYLTSLGMDPAPALTAAGIDASALSEPRGRVSAQQVEALLTQLVEQFPDRNLGLAMASHHHMTDTHVLGLTAIASATGLEALRRLVRYQALVSTQEPFTITEDTETVTLSKKAVHGDTTEHLIQVFIFAVILTAIRNISGFTGDLTGIAFTGVPQGPEADYRQHFGPRVSFASGDASMTIPRAVLEQPVSTGNVDILTANEPLLASLVRAVRENNLPAKIKLAILDSLPDHTLTEEEAATSQNMSLRTFQRRLEDEGTRFRALLDQTRTERAESLLGDPACSLSEVGYHCGFSEQASFSRAFKRWTGKTPSDYRKALLALDH